MLILPGLTSTRKERIPSFIAALRRSEERRIALFPTCLSRAEREELYRELEMIPGLRIPHVHLRSDTDLAEIEYLSESFQVEAFNVHPRKSGHPFTVHLDGFASRVFIENVEVPVEDEELASAAGPVFGGLCPDFSHLENARLHGRTEYVEATLRQMERFPVGCCHLSAIRVGVPNTWAGEWDHHAFARLSDFDYLGAYRRFLPRSWASLELENALEEQLEARAYIEDLFSGGEVG
jgi:hypothetical protein